MLKAHKAGLNVSIKAKAAAHKAQKAGLKASIKAKAAAHKVYKAQKKGDWIYFCNFADVKITFIECPILATSMFFSFSKLGSLSQVGPT